MRRVVCDASAVLASLLDAGPDGQWAAAALAGSDLVAPSLLGFEVANNIRRHELAGAVSADQAAQAHADLLDLAVEHWPYALLAREAWLRRANLTIYDGAYVALAELLDAVLVTLDRRLAGAPGLRCVVRTP